MTAIRLVLVGVFLLGALFLIIGSSPQPSMSGPAPAALQGGSTTITFGTDANGLTARLCSNSNGQILCANFAARIDTNPSGLVKMRVMQALGPITFHLTRVDTSGPALELLRK